MVAKLKPKGCDRRPILGVESAGSFYSTRAISPGSGTWWFDRLRTFLILLVVVHCLPPFVEQFVWIDSLRQSNNSLTSISYSTKKENLCFY